MSDTSQATCTVRLLERDPDLAADLPPDEAVRAARSWWPRWWRRTGGAWLLNPASRATVSGLTD